MTIVVISAGMGVPSSTKLLGDRLADGVVRHTPAAEIVHIELRTLASDLANFLVTRVASPTLREAFAEVVAAEGVVAVTPVFNGSYSGLFKLFFDLLDEGVLAGKPMLLGATGGSVRHSLVIDHSMLPLFHYLKARVTPLGVFAATSDWGSGESALNRRIDAAVAEFSGLMDACPAPAATNEFEVTDFSTLLRG